MGRLRILTANLWSGRADPEGFARLVEAEQVDVACVQELVFEQAEALAEVLPHGRLEPATDFTGMGIALRQPAELGRLPLRARSAHTARLDPKDWPGLSEPLNIWNAHVQAPHCWPHHRSFARRRAQLRGLLNGIARDGGPRLALLGDFNATPLWPVYRRVTEVLSDAALEVATRESRRPARTWPHWSPLPRLRLLRIDHAFVRGVAVKDVSTLSVPGSDHDALRVDLELG